MTALRSCLVVTAFLVLLCCVAYPAAVTLMAHALFSREANGSLVEQGGAVRGSTLIGQTFADPAAHPEYFWGRPSAASVDPATGVVVSSGTNFGPLNPALRDAVRARVALFRATGITGPIPVDLVTSSASGIDPHISPAGAEIQVARIAAARHVAADRVHRLIRARIESPLLGVLGEPRVNVLALNLDLDALR